MQLGDGVRYRVRGCGQPGRLAHNPSHLTVSFQKCYRPGHGALLGVGSASLKLLFSRHWEQNQLVGGHPPTSPTPDRSLQTILRTQGYREKIAHPIKKPLRLGNRRQLQCPLAPLYFRDVESICFGQSNPAHCEMIFWHSFYY